KFLGCPLINDFNEFIKYSDIIVANRIDDALRKCNSKVFTRDIFQYD
ncbi:UDP-glucose 6-dehydrogenase, partial [Streptococcus pyogenes]|nr:UDP-glucose 6-dehydrogenase [Streptococcus pyogenes]HEQ8549725.1 UDP-glucose 6-dehydrogenase [Streptococcus pyogenes]